MPTVKFVNALNSFAGGLADQLNVNKQFKLREADDAEMRRRTAVEEADNARRAAIAERDQAMQEDAYKHQRAASDATQKAFSVANAPVQAPFRSRSDALSSVLPSVDPRFAKDVVDFANRRDLADHTVSQIQSDISNGLYDDIQAGPDGKEVRVPNPERQYEVSSILADLNRGAEPEAALERLARLRAPIIGQRAQLENRARTIEGVRKRMEDAYGKGIDISEATTLFHTMSNEQDPQEWLRDPVNRMTLDSALRGYALVTGSNGKMIEINPADRDEFNREIWERQQLERQLAQYKLNEQMSSAAREQGNIINDRTRAEAYAWGQRHKGNNQGKTVSQYDRLLEQANKRGLKTPEEIDKWIFDQQQGKTPESRKAFIESNPEAFRGKIETEQELQDYINTGKLKDLPK